MKLNHDDMRRILGILPKDVIKLMKAHPIFLAGGYIRAMVAGEQVSDIDLLCNGTALADVYANALAGTRQGKVYRTKNAYTILTTGRTAVQFIHRWTFDDPEKLIASFDFTIAQACIWFTDGKWHSLTSDHFYSDLAAKRLRYCFPDRHEDAGGSLLRVQKFLKRGYDISPEEFAKVMARLIDKIEPGARLWEESEVGKAKVLAGLLRKVDPLTIIDGLEPSDDSFEESAPEEVVA